MITSIEIEKRNDCYEQIFKKLFDPFCLLLVVLELGDALVKKHKNLQFLQNSFIFINVKNGSVEFEIRHIA